VINRTVLMRRVAKYCDHNSGGRLQTGETRLARAAGVATNIFVKMRNNAEPREETLERIDDFLTRSGY
jgi:hypothetical protein